MSNFTLRKTSPTGNDVKITTQGTTLKQQGVHEVNRRRAFLQDNSWIKKRPEEERDENYGREVLHRCNSHDALDRKTNEKKEQRATISRYRSDDTLDRISDRNDAAKTYKANTLDNRLPNRNVSTFRSPEATKTQPGDLFSANATNTPASTSTTTPIKKKRQSWFPPPPPAYNAAPSTGAGRSEELDNLIKMNKSLNRNQGLDGLFRANLKAEPMEKRAKSLENLIVVNTQTDKDAKGNRGLGSLIKVNQRTDKNKKGGEDLDNVIKVNPKESENTTGKQDLNGLIKVNPETDKNIKRGQSLDNLIKVTSEVNRSNPGSEDLDNLIKVNPRTGKSMQEGQSLDSLIKVTPETHRTNQGNQYLDNLIKVTPLAEKSSEQGLDELINVSPRAVKNAAGNQDLDKLIKVNPETLSNNRRNQDLDNLIKVNPAVIRSNQSQDLDNLIKVKPSALRNTKRDQDLENLIEVNSNMSRSNKERQNGQVSGSTEALISLSSRTSAYSYEAQKMLSSKAETRHTAPKDTLVYTRTYVENSKSPKEGYQESISGKYIQTVYSTSDRSVIERDMCTYCRKPLGIETKMILDELQICCHSTCFKCEICKQPLENLQAGDSIWIYRQTIHCEPCYSKVVAKWIQ
ncbi:sciellin isoform X6 [Hippopotamus amphibius kiboko]|uniref:sciellin isoform X6 n=1 Tax=Hippopotamus amphibius kiboko TaxID=575201 RepID=UPI00259497EE|nr:sciellin isoform X6 [Hippopotamus amphibius kiboko]